jgi:hypothetical protein
MTQDRRIEAGPRGREGSDQPNHMKMVKPPLVPAPWRREGSSGWMMSV